MTLDGSKHERADGDSRPIHALNYSAKERPRRQGLKGVLATIGWYISIYVVLGTSWMFFDRMTTPTLPPIGAEEIARYGVPVIGACIAGYFCHRVRRRCR